MSDAMAAGRPGERFEALVRSVVTASTDLSAALTGIAEMGRSGINGCAAASVTLIQQGRPVTVASTDGVARALDQAQYDADTGPCLEAIRTNATVHVRALAADERWQGFRMAASEAGIRSSLSLPLPLAEAASGGLNLYGDEVDAFVEGDQKLAALFASYAAALTANVAAYRSAHELAQHLQVAMESRSVIEQAKGILIARQRCSADDAFDILRRASQRQNRKLRDIAEDLVLRSQQGE